MRGMRLAPAGSPSWPISKDFPLDKALDEANAKGWTLVSMKQDWKKIFAFE